MDNVRSGNLSVKKMKDEIEKDLALLQLKFPSERVKRQISDGEKFLKMISELPYANCKTVSKLKQKISDERNDLKQKVLDLDVHLPGHQFTLFEDPVSVSDNEKSEVLWEIQGLKEEVRWLHKCLGMSSSRNYFK